MLEGLGEGAVPYMESYKMGLSYGKVETLFVFPSL